MLCKCHHPLPNFALSYTLEDSVQYIFDDRKILSLPSPFGRWHAKAQKDFWLIEEVCGKTKYQTDIQNLRPLLSSQGLLFLPADEAFIQPSDMK